MADDVLPVLRSFLVERYGDFKRRLRRALGNDELADDALHDSR
jgi:RNA polymerase sigma-70 factor (ECF subfamily)